MATIAEIRKRALRRIKVLAIGQKPDPAYDLLASNAYVSVHSYYLNTGNINWAVEDDIPEEYEGPIVSLLAERLKGEFPLKQDLVQTLMADKIVAERDLRLISSVDYQSMPVKVTDF